MQGRKNIFENFLTRPRRAAGSRFPGCRAGRTWYNQAITPCKGENFHAGESGRQKATPLGARVWASLLVFGFIGQIAWMVENVYFSTYIQKNITAAGWATSATVAASAIAAALATIFSAAWSDRVGKRRAFVCWGYILWGITTAAFALFGNGQVGGDVGLAVTLFVVMDCVMSAIGSTANDSAFSAWVTDVTDVTNRGVVDIVLSIMPILALIVIFAGFDGMTVHGNWTGFFLVLGGLTSAAGVLGLCIFRDSPALRPVQGDTYLRDVLYAFRPANIRANKMIYICFLGMMFSGLAMQLWQPYMISLVEVTLGIENYILPIGIVVLASAVLSVLAGKVMDRFGKEKFYYPVAILQVLGGLIAYSIKFVGHAMPLLCVGGTCIMAGNLAMAGLFTASSRDYTPAGRAGASQSVKMVIYIMLPMVLASIIDPLIIRAVALEPTAAILAKYPSYAGSYLYPYELFLAAAVSAVFILIPAYFVRRDADRIRREKLAALEKMTPSTERQTAARKKRKTLYPHIFLLTEGRLGCVVFALFPIWFLLMEVKSLALGGFNFADLLGIVISSAVIAATFFYFIPHYWPLCFGKLTLTEGYVKWHALFMRSVKIPYSSFAMLRYAISTREMLSLIFMGPGKCTSCYPRNRFPKSALIKSEAAMD